MLGNTLTFKSYKVIYCGFSHTLVTSHVMTNRSTIATAVVAVVLAFSLIDPLNMVSGRFDANPYSEIQHELNTSSTSGVLVLASYADLYQFPPYRYLRDILGARLAVRGEFAVEFGYEEVLSQASLGEESFLRFLKFEQISHIIIPMETAKTGEVFHRWSKHGTVKLDLSSPAFSLVQQSGGSYPLALYSVNPASVTEPVTKPPTYLLEWAGVRPAFHQLLRITEEGYRVRYLQRYEDRVDTAWVFKGEQITLSLTADQTPEQVFSVELQFVAAYGDKAPPQVLRIEHKSGTQSVILEAQEVALATFDMLSGESITIRDVFGCRQGLSFAPEDQDIREFCYGLRDVKVRVLGS